MQPVEPSVIADLVGAARERQPLLLLCDFDGTLCEFEPDPASVWLSDTRRELLREIASQASTTLGIVSGRRLEDVAMRSGFTTDAIFVAGLHGLEIEGKGERFDHPDLSSARSCAQRIAVALAPLVSPVPGVFIEDKGLSIALHFREASPMDRSFAAGLFDRTVAAAVASGEVRVMAGSNVLEVLPNIAWNKGNAVEWIRSRVERGGIAPFTVYIGDDATDEDAFKATRGHGLSVAASDRVTGADYRVNGPPEVERILAALCLPGRRSHRTHRSGLLGASRSRRGLTREK